MNRGQNAWICPDGESHNYIYRLEISSRVDICFSFLAGIQWFMSVIIPYVFNPLVSAGEFQLDSVNGALLGLLLGGCLAVPTIYLTWAYKGQEWIRWVVMVSQMGFSILFLFLTNGKTEAHFYVFISLATLSFYQDLRVLGLATLIIFINHLLSSLVFSFPAFEYVGWILLFCLVLALIIYHVDLQNREEVASRQKLRLSREKAKHIAALKSDFLSNMSHEIRIPLSSIIGFTEILRDTNLDREQREYVNTVHRCSETLLHLINNILDISKIENGLLKMDYHEFDFRELHKDIYRMFSLMCTGKGLEFELDIDPAIPRLVTGDSHRLRQVLTNLVSNAVKFTESGMIRVDVRLDQANSIYRWRVSDTGKGICAEKIGNLFCSFQQEDSSVARRYGGTGLGLTISKNLIELMGGEISVTSTPGVGTVFTFSLPIEPIKR